jgi:hypothetical protein
MTETKIITVPMATFLLFNLSLNLFMRVYVKVSGFLI